MNTVITSKEAILAACRKLASEQGLQSLNMRTVAAKCGVSVGSVYNYFPSKADLVAATVQDVWKSIFHVNSCNKSDRFIDHVIYIFNSVHASIEEHPNFFSAHSMSFANADKGKGRHVMEQYFQHMKNGLLEVLQVDKNVKLNVFDKTFTQKIFVDFVFNNLILLLMRQEKSCDVLVEVIQRCIY